MAWNHLFLGIIIISFSSQAFVISQGPGLWWDEAVYIGLARSLPQGFFSLDPGQPIESFRPPLLPALLSPAAHSITLMKILALAISFLAVFAVYKLSLPYGKNVAFLSTLFLASSSLFAFFSSKILTESLFILLLSLSLLYFMKWNESKKSRPILLSGAFAGLAFLTRYFASALILSYVAFFIFQASRKRLPKNSLLLFLPTILVLIPWLFVGQAYYHHPFGAYLTNISVYAASAPQTFFQGLSDIGLALTYLPFFILAFFLFAKKDLDKFLPLIMILFITIAIFLLLPHKESRYLLSFLPVYSLLAAIGTESLFEKYKNSRAFILPLIFVLSLITLYAGAQFAYNDIQSSALAEASLYLKEISQPDELILTQSYPFVFVLSERKAIPYCGFESQQAFDKCQGQILNSEFPLEALQATLQKHPIKYILSYKFEPANPEEARSYLDRNFEKIKTFGQYGDSEAVVIYIIG